MRTTIRFLGRCTRGAVLGAVLGVAAVFLDRARSDEKLRMLRLRLANLEALQRTCPPCDPLRAAELAQAIEETRAELACAELAS